MNRIILIGNGFDLAHGLPTRFEDFLEYYWEQIFNRIKNSQPYSKFENKDIIIDSLPNSWPLESSSYDSIINGVNNSRGSLQYKNVLLKKISEYNSINKWVDIENEYYNLLKESFKKEKTKYTISQLNDDFNRLKHSLSEYIGNIENGSELTNRYRNEIGINIYSSFRFSDFTEDFLNRRAEEEFKNLNEKLETIKVNSISRNNLEEKQKKIFEKVGINISTKAIRNLLLSRNAGDYFDLHPENILFLNFNYTKTPEYYTNSMNFEIDYEYRQNVKSINIHGSVYTNDFNPIIFGFGDEIDEDYRMLENLNDNRFLQHIKSIRYLETDNYKKLLEFINSEEYQIFIFGHSCGLSDRTLLNTVFEHSNCVSIKPYYYQKNESSDNYSDLIMNITRNFNDKASLRDKVVNKRFCQPLAIP